MDGDNRLLIFLLIIGLLYALYRYHDIIFNQFPLRTTVKTDKNTSDVQNTKVNKSVLVDDISQISIGSLESDPSVYKQDSAIDSIFGDDFSSANREVGSIGSNDSLFA